MDDDGVNLDGPLFNRCVTDGCACRAFTEYGIDRAVLICDVVEEEHGWPPGKVIRLTTYVIQGSTPQHAAAMEWSRFHNVDPNAVPRGSTMVRDPFNHRIIFERFRYEPGLDGLFEGIILNDERDDAESEQRTEQGEAGPLPLPTEVTERCPYYTSVAHIGVLDDRPRLLAHAAYASACGRFSSRSCAER